MSGKTSSTCWRPKYGEAASFEEILKVYWYITCAVFYTKHKPQETLCKWRLIVMYSNKTNTKKKGTSIRKYSYKTYFALWYSVFILWTPLTYRDELSIEGLKTLLSLVMYRFCSNKGFCSASLSSTRVIAPATVARRVLQNRVCPSFSLSRYFLGIGSLFFSKFWHTAGNLNDIVCGRITYF